MEIEAKYYDPNCYWNGKKIVSLDQWYQIKEGYDLKAALEVADRWYSDYLKLMEYVRIENMEKRYAIAVL
jgi:hypothetical protein